MPKTRFNIEEKPESVKLTVWVDATTNEDRTKPFEYKQHINCNSVEEANQIVKEIKSFEKNV